MTGLGLDPDRRAALNAAKLAALVAGRWGAGERERHVVGSWAALLGPPSPGDGCAGRTAWVLVDDAPDRALGPALVWSERHQVDDLHVVADAGRQAHRGGDAAGALARQASLFSPPQPTVW
ncbi:MAG: hypothetical protein ACRDZN_01305, partial [Acidimicrobiales bacterium]